LKSDATSEIFFFTRKRGDTWNALSIIAKSTPPTKRKRIDEASGVSSSSSSNRKIKKKEQQQRIENAPHADAGVRRPQIDPDRWSF
jgi:hypothetical protein